MHEFIIDKCELISESISAIENYLQGINTAEDFKKSFDTNNVVRFRDLISHHYEKLDTEIVFEIRTIDIPELKQKIQTFLSNSNDQSV